MGINKEWKSQAINRDTEKVEKAYLTEESEEAQVGEAGKFRTRV
jgi:hypothetical protein